MINFSRRQLAKYAVDELEAKKPIAALVSRLAAALVASGRKKEVDLLLADIDQELENRQLLAKARVTTANPLSGKLRQQLSAQLKKMTGVKDVILHEEVDKALIGGVKVETATRSWDRTLSQALSKLKENV